MHKCTENTYAFVCITRYIQLFVKKKFYNIPYIVICEDVRINLLKNSIDKFYIDKLFRRKFHI